MSNSRMGTTAAGLCAIVALTAGLFAAPDSPASGGGQTTFESNYVTNGDFENAIVGWTKEGDVHITSTAHLGANSLLVSDPDTSRLSFVWQPLGFGYAQTTVTVWVYPYSNTYRSHFSLINGWHTPAAVSTSVLEFRHNGIIFAVPGTSEWIPVPLVQASWNHVEIRADSTTKVQELRINGELVASLTATSFPILEHLHVGDLSVLADHGTVAYDDISITGTVAPVGVVAVDDGCTLHVNNSPGDTCTIPVLQNDSGQGLSVTGTTKPPYGDVSVSGESIKYQAKHVPPNFKDIFSYTVSDGASEDTATVTIVFDCGCYLTLEACEQDFVGKRSDTIDPNLLHRFRDELMLPTLRGARFADYYYNLPELLHILILDRPDLRPRFVSLVESLQPAIRDVLEGDGSLAITQAQVDSVSAFINEVASVASASLRDVIENELAAMDPLDSYAGMAAGDVIQAVLADPVRREREREMPSSGFRLDQNFPNPFEFGTEIRYALPGPSPVSLSVFDIRGRRVRTLVERVEGPGEHAFIWDGADDGGMAVASGVYFIRLSTPSQRETRKMVVRR